MENQFLEFKKEMISKLPYKFNNGLTWKMDYIPANEYGNGYYDFHEYDGNKSYSGFSCPDFKSFKDTMLLWVSDYLN